ncbi:MAG: quinate 5-dehydrogenase [Clostridia bacterium]|nr:quinate 5-dehydrogenase [Clostridia bacterium]
MKRIVSVSIGSSRRDKSIETEFLGEKFLVERIGTDGDINKAIELIKTLDGKVDAFGMGGIDLYLTTGTDRRYIIKDAIPLWKAAKQTPIVDGSGIKNTLEKRVIKFLNDSNIIDFKNKKVLMTSAADRYKMASAFVECGCDVTIGDLIFALGIPVPIRRLRTFKGIAELAIPVVSRLPFELLYPTGEKQKENRQKRFISYYKNADIIAGDYHYIKKYMPMDMSGKTIVTNTVTPEDIEVLKNRRVSVVVTTTPNLGGRSFGTNVMEALLVGATGKRPEELEEEDYYSMLDKLDFKPRIEYLN